MVYERPVLCIHYQDAILWGLVILVIGAGIGTVVWWRRRKRLNKGYPEHLEPTA